MRLGPMGRALHSVNAVGGDLRKRELGGSRARMESARGRRRDREKFLRRTRGMRGLECILHGPRLPGVRGEGTILCVLLAGSLLFLKLGS